MKRKNCNLHHSSARLLHLPAFLYFLPALLLAMTTLHASAQVKLAFDMGQRGALIGTDHYGIFYEEINHAGDGGLYAELIRNRSFEEDTSQPAYWNVVGSGRITLDSKHLLNIHQDHSLCLVASVATAGIRNDGYWGMKFESGKQYELSFWIMSEEDKDCKFQTELQASDGTVCGRSTFKASLVAGEWQRLTATIKATKNVTGGKFCLRPGAKGTFYIDVVSLFPPTFKNRKNGCRVDLAQKLYDLKPGFVRFPGGCYIEGLWANGKDNRFEWKKTIGPIEERPGHRNQNWGYNITDGQGYHEYLELCEDLGASAMFVVNMGWGHDWQVSIDDIGPYIQEALDAIEYAMGDTTTTYGRMRAQNGHPEPFDLKYMEIGNENEWFDNYPGRYAEFYKAIKTRWPQVHLIANGRWNNAFPAEICDEHYYVSPEWFVSQYRKYDDYPRARTKVYVGEYAVTQNPGRYGNLSAAIGEAVFMQGMENNSDAVIMGSYAPIFANENAVAWHPDMIRFNSSMSYGTPSYYVQKLFANYVGKQNIKWTETDNVPPAEQTIGSIGVGTWATAATFTNLNVIATGTSFEGNATAAADWTEHDGQWSFSGGTFRQTNTSAAPAYCTYNTAFDNKNLTFTLKATKNSGSEGFLILLDYRDGNNYTWWNIGGWGNTKHGVEQCVGGSKRTVTDKEGSLETGHEYTIRIVKEDTRCRCYLDNELIHDFTIGGSVDQAVYTSANIDDETGTLYVKLVNPSNVAAPTLLSFTNGRVTDASAQVLTSARGTDENSTSSPNNVIPRKRAVTVSEDGTIAYEVPAYSVNILILSVTDVNVSEEQVTLPEPLVCYSFENDEPADDSGTYQATLQGAAAIVGMPDGNHALHTGAIGGKGYLDMGTQMPKAILPQLADYSISVNILLGVNNTTGSYCWGYALANSTSQYIGLVNAGGNGNWYYELKGSTTHSLRSNTGLNPTIWHNLTYTQADGVGRFYVDGQLRSTSAITVMPKSIASSIKSAWLARSPFTNDAYLENAFIDDFSIYATALSAEQVMALANQVVAMQVPSEAFSGITDTQDFRNLVKEVKNYVNQTSDEELKNAYTAAAKLLNSTNTTAVQKAKATLEAAVERYTSAQLECAVKGGVELQDDPLDLTFLLKNSSFTLGPTYWIGADTPFSPVDGKNGVVAGYGNESAEMFNRSFDIYQVLSGLPAGYYMLTASAFYRAGAIAAAWKAKDDEASKRTEIYLNNQAVPVVSLYDETEAYTYEPYTYPDNLTAASKALNNEDLAYAQNVVVIQLAEGERLRCGIRKLSTIASDWTAYDNFRLYYLGPEVEWLDVRSVDASAPVLRSEYVWPDGIRSPRACRGVNILRSTHDDGGVSTRKIYRP